MVLNRCRWADEDDALMLDYHDVEWGVPIFDRQALFERLMLEAFQAGLSWRVVLHKREAMRARFLDFDSQALCSASSFVDTWMEDTSIIRNRAKLDALIKNAIAYEALGDPVDFLWSIVDRAPRRNRFARANDVPSRSVEGDALSKRLKKAGFSFMGPVVCYAFMQSAGFVNDHIRSCFRWAPIDASIQASVEREA